MKTRTLAPHCDLRVSEVSFGGMSLGQAPSGDGLVMPDVEALRVLDMAFDAGVNTVDTSNIYSDGESERLLGNWLSGKRDRVIVATKCRFPVHEMTDQHLTSDELGLSRTSVIRSCEASLRRLKTDYIDLFQLHMQDATVPIEETLRALDDLVKDGKVRYVGCSNYTAYRVVEALWTSDRAELPSFASLQLPWSLVLRDVERELVPTARNFDLGVLVYSPLARGFLTGKYERAQDPPPGSRLQRWGRIFDEYDQSRWTVLHVVRTIAKNHDATPAQIAIAWLLAKSEVSSVLLGVKSEGQMQELLVSRHVTLTDDELRELDRISAPQWGYPYSLIQRYEPW